MSELTTLPAPVIQMGFVEKQVAREQNQPHIQQLVAQESARQALRKEAEKVPQVDVSEHGKKVRERDSEREKKEMKRQLSRSKNASQGESQKEGDEQESQGKTPWSGNIVNMQV